MRTERLSVPAELHHACHVALTVNAPAKLNLFLAITGRRSDGFHDLVSLVAPIEVGDRLTVASAPAGEFSLSCSDSQVPNDENNLVMKAARAFVAATGWRGGAEFQLEKQVPVGAGLGGGSSDAVAALRAVNELAGKPLQPSALLDVAATVGSDCPLFMTGEPVIMRGRGERVERLPANVIARIRGRRVLVFKPEFGIATAWAYRRLADMADALNGARPAASSAVPVYIMANEADRRISTWIADAREPLESLLFNNLERPAFGKFVALPTLLEDLRETFGLCPRMSGSGSACFALLPENLDVAPIVARIRAAWGDSVFVRDTRLA